MSKAKNFGRRGVLKGATATAALLTAARAALPAGAFAQAAGPETKSVKLGFIALTDAAPLIVAKASEARLASRGSADWAATWSRSRATAAAGPSLPRAQAARWATAASPDARQSASTPAVLAAACPARPRSVTAQYAASGTLPVARVASVAIASFGGGPSSSSAATAHSRTRSSASPQARTSGIAAVAADSPMWQSFSAAAARSSALVD